jgi:hypothetical protein
LCAHDRAARVSFFRIVDGMSLRSTLLASFALAAALNAQETILWSEKDPRCSRRYGRVQAPSMQKTKLSKSVLIKGQRYSCPLFAPLPLKTAADILILIVSGNYPASFVVNLKAMPVEKRSHTSIGIAMLPVNSGESGLCASCTCRKF